MTAMAAQCFHNRLKPTGILTGGFYFARGFLFAGMYIRAGSPVSAASNEAPRFERTGGCLGMAVL